MSFLDFLNSYNVDVINFACVVIGIILAVKIIKDFMYGLIDLATLPFVLLGKWNDVKRDKFLWHRNNYVYRKIEGLYDQNGYCVKSIYYKYVNKKYGGISK